MKNIYLRKWMSVIVRDESNFADSVSRSTSSCYNTNTLSIHDFEAAKSKVNFFWTAAIVNYVRSKSGLK